MNLTTVGAVFSDYFAAAMIACRAGLAYGRGDFEGADELAVLTDRTYLDSSSSIAAQEQASRRSGLPGAKTAKLKLSKQQAHMIELLARGCTNAEIVDITGLSLSTVKTHTSHAYRKLGVHTMQDAVLEARRRGLIG